MDVAKPILIAELARPPSPEYRELHGQQQRSSPTGLPLLVCHDAYVLCE
jgi:hypothetical protein